MCWFMKWTTVCKLPCNLLMQFLWFNGVENTEFILKFLHILSVVFTLCSSLQEFDFRFAFPLCFYNAALNFGVAGGVLFLWGSGFSNTPSSLFHIWDIYKCLYLDWDCKNNSYRHLHTSEILIMVIAIVVFSKLNNILSIFRGDLSCSDRRNFSCSDWSNFNIGLPWNSYCLAFRILSTVISNCGTKTNCLAHFIIDSVFLVPDFVICTQSITLLVTIV